MHTKVGNPADQNLSSLKVQIGAEELHLQCFGPADAPAAVLLLHGSIENGRIFYSKSGRGLAPWLAEHGFRVFVADLRGRGKSRPKVSAQSRWGSEESIGEDIPALHAAVAEQMPGKPIHWMAHSWGGVLMLAALARFTFSPQPASLTTFGSKRHVSIGGPRRWFYVDLMWNYVSRLLVKRYGYLPAHRFGLGSDDESARSHRETLRWVLAPDWTDPQDGFDYAAALKQKSLPPALYITGQNDHVLGNPIDVQRLMRESGQTNTRFLLAGKARGFRHDYDHINLLTHPDAPQDVFPRIMEWMKSLESK